MGTLRRPEPAEASTRLAAARLAGAGAIAIFGQLAVDMPDGYFGGAGTITTVGLVFTVSLSLAVLVGVVTVLQRSRAAVIVRWVVLPIGIGLFLPAVATDPVVSGGVILWNLVLLGTAELGGAWTGQLRDDPVSQWAGRNGAAARHLVLVALVLSTLVVGYGVGHRLGAMMLCAIVDAVAITISLPLYRLLWLAGARIAPVLAATVLASAVGIAVVWGPTGALVAAAGFLVVTAVQLVSLTPWMEEVLGHFLRYPSLLVATSFVLLIAVGTVFLSLPVAAPEGQHVAPADALFTATSAACVTGLIVLDTPNDFSVFGHVVILILIQVGGLNIMVLSTFAALLLGRNVGLRGEAALGDVLDLASPATAVRLVIFIVLTTIAVEAGGAIALGLRWAAHGAPPLVAAWNGLFHSVSAFCNAGFALQTDSLVMFSEDPWVLLTVSALIVGGGLGFAVLAGVWTRLRGGRRPAVEVQTRVAVTASAVLIVLGWLLVAGFEWRGCLDGMSVADRLVNALFQSVTARTAGFNSIDIGALRPVTVLVMMVLMFIGASPGGTGGGIKTTTLVVLLAAIPAIAARRNELVVFRRRLPLSIVYRAAAIAVVGLGLVILCAGALMASQDGSFESLLFESVSAFGTVGLSLGTTASLDGFGKIVVVLAMAAGRVGPLTLALLLGQARETRLSYPRARIMVG